MVNIALCIYVDAWIRLWLMGYISPSQIMLKLHMTRSLRHTATSTHHPSWTLQKPGQRRMFARTATATPPLRQQGRRGREARPGTGETTTATLSRSHPRKIPTTARHRRARARGSPCTWISTRSAGPIGLSTRWGTTRTSVTGSVRSLWGRLYSRQTTPPCRVWCIWLRPMWQRLAACRVS